MSAARQFRRALARQTPRRYATLQEAIAACDARGSGPPLVISHIAHETGCRAPVLACTCSPIVTYSAPTEAEFVASARAEAELRASIKRGLD